MTGVLKEYLNIASDSVSNAKVEFVTIGYHTADEAIKALLNDEVDCAFPANFSEYESEMLGIMTTSPFMTTEMDAIVRTSDQKEFIRKDKVIVL